jgi:hypothetical protein
MPAPPILAPEIGDLPPDKAARQAALTKPQLFPAGRAPAPTQPEWFTAQTSGTVAVGPATLSRFSELITRPGVLESITFTLNTADPNSQNIFPFIREGGDDTAGVTTDDHSVFTYVDSLGTVSQLFRGENAGGPLNLPLNVPILDTPFRVHLRLVNNSGINPMGVSAIWLFRVIPPDQLRTYAPPHLPLATQHAAYAFAPRPPSARIAGPSTPAGVVVSSLGFQRIIPWGNLAPELRREYTTNQANGVPTPGIRGL